MPSEVTNYQCPSCTGPLRFSGESGKMECEYCGSSYTVQEIEKLFRQKDEEAAAASQSKSRQHSEDLAEGLGGNSQGMKSYSCPSCGAELICDENTAATCCPYCGNQTVIPGQFSGSFKPEFVIPFKTDKAAAVQALKNHYQGKILLPKSFADGNHVEEIQGVYVPFWMFDAEASGEMLFDASRSTVRVHGDEEVTTTEHFDVYRGGMMSFEKVPVDASSRMPDGHMDAIEPFDYSEIVPFSTAYMPGFLANKYDLSAEECEPRMENRCTQALCDALRDTVTGYDNKSETSRKVTVRENGAHYAMLPAWLLATKWNGQNFLFAMNGQTGQLVGDLPMDKGKYWSMFAGIAVVLAALAFFLVPSVSDGSADLFVSILVCGVVPLVISLLVMSILRGQLKSVYTASAGRYISGDGLKITGEWDRHTRTDVSRRRINREPPKK